MLFGAMSMLVASGALKNSENVSIALYFSLMFPIGLGILLGGPGSGILGIILIILSYVSYIVIFISFIYARLWVSYGLLCLVFAVLLLLNVAGCREMSKGFSNITMKHHVSAPMLTSSSERHQPSGYRWQPMP
jgi:hypothetical protein